MSKRFTKIICVSVSVIAALGVGFGAGCAVNSPLDGNYSDGEVVSNGGFAVQKGDYLYFINGVEANTANNEKGAPVKGAVYRIKNSDLAERNYSSVQKVVNQIAYTTDYEAGIFIYGDYIYYGTPSTARNSEGVVQNTLLDMKSTKLNGTDTKTIVQFPSTSYEYRFVEAGAGDDKTVYLMYVATEEKLYEEETGVTNLHSYNLKTGTDTLLAYNVESVVFDEEDKTNASVYYTMKVHNYSTSSDFGYNQVYTVTADETEDEFKDKLSSEVIGGWDDEKDRYINCGTLVMDGVGQKDVNGSSKTPFNYLPEDITAVNELSYTYKLTSYLNDTLLYTRKTSNNSDEYLFAHKDNDTANPIDANLSADKRILSDGSKAGDYKFIFNEDGSLYAAIIAESAGGISINKAENNKLQPADKLGINEKYFKIVKEGTATLISLDGNWLYYSVTGGNGLTINRIDYSGTVSDYEPLNAGETKYTSVRILDLDADSNWFKPEFIDGYLLFASETTNMTAFNYVMVFDMHGKDGLLANDEIRDLNEKYEGIGKTITDVYGDTEKYPADKYANLQNALNYASYGGDYEYLKDLAKAANDKVEEDGDPVYSEQTFAEYDAFLAPAEGSVWAEYTDYKTVNGKKVYANMRDYYYCLLGEMSEADETAYQDGLKSSYLTAWPEDEKVSWYAGLSTGAKAGFIVGMCAIGLLVAGGVAVLTIYLVRRNKKKMPEMRKKRVKVDTTDDKDIDVYAD